MNYRTKVHEQIRPAGKEISNHAGSLNSFLPGLPYLAVVGSSDADAIVGSDHGNVLLGGGGGDVVTGGSGDEWQRDAIKSVAALASKQGLVATFYSKKWYSGCRSGCANTLEVRARSARLVGRKCLGRLVDGAWANSFENWLAATHWSLSCAA